jgi:hypothetical protein
MNKKLLTKYISSFTIGDGGLYTSPRHRYSYYQTKKTEKNKDYIDWQANILNELTYVNIMYTEAATTKYGYNSKGYFTLTTRQHPIYHTIRERMYLDGKKVISLHDLKLFDAESLAILFMDDGCLHVTQKKTCTYPFSYIATHNYSYGDNDLLRRFIKDRFDIHFNICQQRQNGNLYHFLKCTKQQTAKLIHTIEPYILESFRYKVELPDEWLLSDQDDDIVETVQQCTESDRNDLAPLIEE